jgi:hypothetical protein
LLFAFKIRVWFFNSDDYDFDDPRFTSPLSWPTLLSVVIHGAVVAGLLYTSVHQVIEMPAPAQPISVTMVTPAELEPQVSRRRHNRLLSRNPSQRSCPGATERSAGGDPQA